MEFYKEAPYKSSYTLASDVVYMMNSGQVIKPFTEVRDWTGLGLKDAKTIIDIIKDEMENFYDYRPEQPLSVDDLDTLFDFAEGVIIGVVTLNRDHNKRVHYSSGSAGYSQTTTTEG